MNKKQIKHVRIDIDASSASDAKKLIESVNAELKAMQDLSKGIGGHLKGPIKSLEKLAAMAKGSAATFKKLSNSAAAMNKSMTGNKQATNRLQSYIDNLEITTAHMKDLADESARAEKAITKIGSHSNMGTAEASIASMIDQLDAMVEILARTERHTEDMVKESIRGYDRLEDSLSHVSDQTRKGRKAQREYNDEMREGTHTSRDHENQTRRTNQAVSGLGRTSGRAGKHLAKMSGGGFGIVGVYATIAANVYALSEAFRVLSEAANLDRLLGQTASFSAAVSGVNVKSLAADMSRLSGSILSVKESMQFAIKGAAFSFTTDQLEKLTVGARKSSIALGINFTDAMDRVMRGISKQEIELFDELGIVTRLTPAFKTYATAVNKTVAELSDYERQLALTNEVQAQLDQRFSGIEVSAHGWEKLGKAVKDFSDNALMGASSALEEYAAALAEVLTLGDEASNSTAMLAESVKGLDKVTEGSGQHAVALGELGKSLSNVLLLTEETSSANAKSSAATNTALLAVGLLTIGLVALKVQLALAAIGIYSLQGAFTVLAATASAAWATILLPITAIIAGVALISGLLIYPIMKAEEEEAANKAAADAIRKKAEAELIYQKHLVLVEKQTGINIEATRNEARIRVEARNDELKARLLLTKQGSKEHKAAIRAIAEANTLFQETNTLISERGNALKQGNIAMKDSADKLLGMADASMKLTSPFSDALIEMNAFTDGLAANYGGGALTAAVEESERKFKEMKKEMQIKGDPFGPGITSAEKLKDAIESVHFAEIALKHERAKRTALDTLAGRDKVQSLTNQRNMLNILLSQETGLGGIAAARRKELKDQIELMDMAIDISRENLRVTADVLKVTRAESIESERMAGYAQRESSMLDRKQDVIDAVYDAKVKSNVLDDVALKLLEEQRNHAIKVLGIQKQQAIAMEAQVSAMQKLDSLNAKAVRETKATDDFRTGFGERKSKVQTNSDDGDQIKRDIAKKQLELKHLSTETTSASGEIVRQGTDEEIIRVRDALADLNSELTTTDQLAGMASVNDFADNVGDWKAHLDGWDLTPLQSTFMDVFGEVTNSLGLMNAAFAETKEGMNDTSFLGGLSFGFSSLMDQITGAGEYTSEEAKIAAEAAAEATLDGLNAIGQMGMAFFQEMSAGKVAGYDREIAAEKKRDGKSAESLNKIKSLETKKIKEKAKADKSSVIMGTAVGMIRAFSDLGWPAGIPAAAAMAAMGALQVSNIDKAASGSMAALSGGGASGMKITGGTRDNGVDVSKSATAGEYAFVSGGMGQGSSGNFKTPPGRAGGGYSEAGTSIMVGESGPEMITPAIPVNVTSSGESSSAGGNITFAPVFNASAIDANGMENLFQNYSRELYDGLQSELEANNKSL